MIAAGRESRQAPAGGRPVRLLLVALAVWLPVGCRSVPPGTPGVDRPLSYKQLRRAYNERPGRIKQLWARAVVEARWIDDRGRRRFEQGDGPLIVRKPHEMALAIGKLGEIISWLGCNKNQFWVFEMRPPEGQPSTAHVGRNRDVGKKGMPSLPLPLHPHQLIQLLAIDELPGSVPGMRRRPAVTLDTDGRHVVTYELKSEGGPLEATVTVDRSFRPVRFTLKDQPTTADGRAGERNRRLLLEAKVSAYEPLPIYRKPPGYWPHVPTRVQINVPGRQASFTLFLENLTDGRERNKVRSDQFDFDTIRASLEPAEVRELKPVRR